MEHLDRLAVDHLREVIGQKDQTLANVKGKLLRLETAIKKLLRSDGHFTSTCQLFSCTGPCKEIRAILLEGSN